MADHGKHKKKSSKQVRYLLSSASPLSAGQKRKLKGELHSGAVKVSNAKGRSRAKKRKRTVRKKARKS